MLFSYTKEERNAFVCSPTQYSLKVSCKSAKKKQSPLGPSVQKGECSQFLWELLVQLFWLQGSSTIRPTQACGPKNLKLIIGSSREVFWSWPTQLQIWCLFFLSSSLVFTNQETIFPRGREPSATFILLKPTPCPAASILLSLSKIYEKKKNITMSKLEWTWEIIWFSLSGYKETMEALKEITPCLLRALNQPPHILWHEPK